MLRRLPPKLLISNPLYFYAPLYTAYSSASAGLHLMGWPEPNRAGPGQAPAARGRWPPKRPGPSSAGPPPSPPGRGRYVLTGTVNRDALVTAAGELPELAATP